MNITTFISIRAYREIGTLKNKKGILNKFIKFIILTVSVGCAKIQLGSLQEGQFLHLTFLVATLLSKIFFCSSGLSLLNSSKSIKFFFCSSFISLFSCLFSSLGFPSCSPSCLSLFSSLLSFSVFCSPGLAALDIFFVGNFFLNLLKNYIIMSIFYFIFFIFEF